VKGAAKPVGIEINIGKGGISIEKKQEVLMTHKLGLTLTATLMFVVAGMAGPISKSVAEPTQNILEIPTDISSAKKSQGGGGGARNAGRSGGGARTAGGGGGRNVRGPSIQHNVSRSNVSRSNVSRSNVSRTNVSRTNVSRSNVGRSNVGQVKTGQGNVVQRNAVQSGRGLSAVSIRGASQARVAGRNFSVWRGSHRARVGGNWRTFAALSTLGAVMFGTSYYYPYAYIDAPAPYCEGLTEDGCQLQWREVPTLEGPQEFQCVAYCPWQ
jgi:hypothetical protein